MVVSMHLVTEAARFEDAMVRLHGQLSMLELDSEL